MFNKYRQLAATPNQQKVVKSPQTNPMNRFQQTAATTNTTAYNPKNYQPGWGIGYNDNNISNDFGEWYNPQALQTEINRVNTVMGNRSTQGLGNDAYTNYLDKLNGYNKPYAQVDPSKFRSESATIDDLAQKYGFDYSREYAKRQAEAEAQAKRNANADAQRRNESNSKVGKQEIDNNLMSMAEGLDRNYFQQYMQQAQNQVNGGMNSGIAADQDLRLAMSRQAEMGDSYRDANLGKMRINEEFNLNDLRLAEEMGLIDQQSLAREDSLYNERLNQAFGQIMDINQLNQTYDAMGLDAALRQRSENMDYNQFDRNLSQQKRQFEFDKEQFRWDKLLEEAGLTGDFKGKRTLEGQQFDWGKAWNQYQFNNVSATDQAQMNQSQSQFDQNLSWDQSKFAQNMEWDKTQWNNLSAAEQMQAEMTMRELEQALAQGQSYNELSPDIKAFIDSGGKIQNGSQADYLLGGLGGGGGGSSATSSPGNYNNYYKTKKEFGGSGQAQSFTMNLNAAMKNGGFPSSWTQPMIELVGRESSWNPNAKNPNSTAHGYGQFLNSTRKDYEKKYGISYSNPVNQLVLMMHYVKDRYGTPEKALQFWDKNNWY